MTKLFVTSAQMQAPGDAQKYRYYLININYIVYGHY